MTAFSATSNPKEHSKGLAAPKGLRIAIRKGVGTGHGAKIVAASMATTTSLKSRNLARLYRIKPRSLQPREGKKKECSVGFKRQCQRSRQMAIEHHRCSTLGKQLY